MKQEKLKIENIPAILYGKESDKLYIFVHGKHSNKEKALEFANTAVIRGYQVLSFDLPEHGERRGEQYKCSVQNAVHDLHVVYSFVENKYRNLALFACSLGAYFSLVAYRDIGFDKCLFVSPILDMEKLIKSMMEWSNITENELRDKEEIETSFGETLSWDYYQYVKNHPVDVWNNATAILYGENDNLAERSVVDSFAAKFDCRVDVFAGGEHYFHTREQLDYLANWISKEVE